MWILRPGWPDQRNNGKGNERPGDYANAIAKAISQQLFKRSGNCFLMLKNRSISSTLTSDSPLTHRRKTPLDVGFQIGKVFKTD